LATTKKTAKTSGAAKPARPKIGSSHTVGRAKAGAKVGAKAGAKAAPKRAASGAAPAAKRAPVKKKGVDKSHARGTGPRKGETKRLAAHEANAPVSVRKKAEPRASGAVNEAAKLLALTIATAALDKKAVNVQIVDVNGRVDYADYLVLMSGRAERHVVSIADGIEEECIKLTPKHKPTAVEGRTPGQWVILDFGDVIAHVFLEEARSFYDFDALWTDARRVPLSVEQRPS
jgi:ribosome-associated protein